MVVLLQMTYLGAPMVYYGDEAGMWGGDDPCDRLPMVWDDLKYHDQAGDPLGRPRQADKVAFDAELFEFYRDAIALRREHEALRRGSWAPAASDDEAQFFAFQRRLGDKAMYVAFNRGDKNYAWKLPAEAGAVEAALATEDAVVDVRRAGGGVEVVVPALTGVALTGR
jgi:glycosidase